MNYNDNHYSSKLKNKISDKTKISGIKYINCYDGYYIVMDDNYIYLYDDKYHELLKEDRILMHKNTNNYDIIYKDGKLMYFKDYLKDDKLIYRYYNLYNYELIDEVLVGGSND